MAYPQFELGNVRMSFVNSENHTQRVERISRLTFGYLQELIERDLSHFGSDRVIDYLEIPPIPVSFDTMDDEAIARVSATGIYRVLLGVV
jgi:hypothetical protein